MHTNFNQDRNNNFDFLRIFAASLVVFAHSFDLLSTPDGIAENSEPLRILTNNQMSLGSLGVAIFFCLSGYLITQSLQRSSSYKTFFTKRSLRIFPALILDLFIAVFLWGASVTSLSVSEYFTNPTTYRYLLNVCLFKISYFLPGVFEHNIFPNYVNGSLWTLPYEFLCYVGIAVLNMGFILKNRFIYAVFLFVGLFGGFIVLRSSYSSLQIPHTDLQFDNFFILSSYFGMGALFFLFKDKIIYKFSITVVLLVVWLIAIDFNLSIYVGYFCLPYIVFWFVFEPRIQLYDAGKWGDFSYGIYIYSFPVQQTIIYYFGNQIPVSIMITLSFLFTVPLAMFSWFAVEKKALNLKDKLFPRIS